MRKNEEKVVLIGKDGKAPKAPSGFLKKCRGVCRQKMKAPNINLALFEKCHEMRKYGHEGKH